MYQKGKYTQTQSLPLPSEYPPSVSTQTVLDDSMRFLSLTLALLLQYTGLPEIILWQASLNMHPS